jgi:hypothetical protein
MSDTDPNSGTVPEDAPDSNPDGGREDERSDLQQAVEARADAVTRGEGGTEPSRFTDPGAFDGNSGTGGDVKNQDLAQQ